MILKEPDALIEKNKKDQLGKALTLLLKRSS